MDQHRIYAMSFAKVYPLLVAKAEKKGRTRAEVDRSSAGSPDIARKHWPAS